MLSKNKIKFINTLKKKKTRYEEGLFLVEGEKIVNEVIRSPLKIKLLCGKPNFTQALSKKEAINIEEIIDINDTDLSKISSLKTPNQVLAVVEQPKHAINLSNTLKSLSLVLDRINDPGNLGTIVRIADWFGINEVFCSDDTVDIYNPKAIQATMGAITRIRVHYVNLKNFLSEFTNRDDFPIYGCFLEGTNIYEEQLKQKGLIVMGSESHGISDEIESHISNRIYIPSFSENNQPTSESLNVSIATGIVCSEFRRR